MKKYIICFLLLLCVGGAAAGYLVMHENERLRGEEAQYIEDNAAAAAAGEVTRTTTKLIAETYDEQTKEVSKEIVNIPSAFLGLTRTQLIEKLAAYMDDMPLEELNSGLVNYELMYFSPEYIMTRKTYNLPEDFNKYYIRMTRGCITVYYSDQDTVCEYTDIQLEDLPENLQASVISGMKIRGEKELYDFLENYSS